MAAPPIRPPSNPGQKPLPPPVPEDGGEALDTDELAPAAAAAGFLAMSAFELDVGPGLLTGEVPVLASDATFAVVSGFAAGSDFADDGTDVDGDLARLSAGLPPTLCVWDDDVGI